MLQVGSGELAAADPGGADIDFYVCIRGEDVTLERGRAEQSSARNHLRGKVAEIVPAGVLTKVIVDVGFDLVALVTRQAVADLELIKGADVFAVFKASAVHLIPNARV
jgi:molybdopterin-binding protein